MPEPEGEGDEGAPAPPDRQKKLYESNMNGIMILGGELYE
jgi:hypothetical protein